MHTGALPNFGQDCPGAVARDAYFLLLVLAEWKNGCFTRQWLFLGGCGYLLATEGDRRWYHDR